MKRLLVLIFSVAFLYGCATVPDPRVDQLEAKVKKLERQVMMGAATGAGKNIYPVTGALTGGGTGALDKITSVADQDAALVMFNDEATWGDAFIPYTANDGAETEYSPYAIDPDEAGTIRWQWVPIYGRSVYGNAPYLSIGASCVIGTDCDGALVRIAWGGTILVTADAVTITLPEIVASGPTAVQVTPGAYLCVFNKDDNENFILDPHANDYIIDEVGAPNAIGEYIGTTDGTPSTRGDYICLWASDADYWMVSGYKASAIVKE